MLKQPAILWKNFLQIFFFFSGHSHQRIEQIQFLVGAILIMRDLIFGRCDFENINTFLIIIIITIIVFYYTVAYTRNYCHCHHNHRCREEKRLSKGLVYQQDHHHCIMTIMIILITMVIIIIIIITPLQRREKIVQNSSLGHFCRRDQLLGDCLQPLN